MKKPNVWIKKYIESEIFFDTLKAFFKNIESGVTTEMAYMSPPSLSTMEKSTKFLEVGTVPVVSDSLGLSYLIGAYQVQLHEMATLDPLELTLF